MCYTYDKSKGGDTRELQGKMVPPQKNGSSHLNRIKKRFPQASDTYQSRIDPSTPTPSIRHFFVPFPKT